MLAHEMLAYAATDTTGDRLLLVGKIVGGIAALIIFTVLVFLAAIAGVVLGPVLIVVGFAGWLLFGAPWAGALAVGGAAWFLVGIIAKESDF